MPHESAYFSINKDVGLHDTGLLKRALDSIPGVTSVSINKDECSVAVDYDNIGATHSAIQKKIEILGYPIEATH